MQLNSQDRDQVISKFNKQLYNYLGTELKYQLLIKVRNKIWHQLWDQLQNRSWGKLGKYLWEIK